MNCVAASSMGSSPRVCRCARSVWPRELGVSRIPLREAIRHLEAEGLVTSELHKGTVVSSLSPSEIEELFGIRMQLETWLFAAAIPRMTDADFARAEAVIEEALENGRFRELERAELALPRGALQCERQHDRVEAAALGPRQCGALRQPPARREARRRARAIGPPCHAGLRAPARRRARRRHIASSYRAGLPRPPDVALRRGRKSIEGYRLARGGFPSVPGVHLCLSGEETSACAS